MRHGLRDFEWNKVEHWAMNSRCKFRTSERVHLKLQTRNTSLRTSAGEVHGSYAMRIFGLQDLVTPQPVLAAKGMLFSSDKNKLKRSNSPGLLRL